MHWQTSLPYTVPLCVAAALTSFAAVVAWRQRSVPGARALMGMGIAAALWSLAYALELGTVGSPAALFWARIQYIGIMALPVAWVLFALGYTNRHHWVSRGTVAALLAVPLATQALVWTNDSHGLIWPRITLDASGPIPLLVYDHGIAFWVCNAFAHASLLLGAVLLLSSFRQVSRIYLMQMALFVLGAIAPWVANGIYVLGLTPWPGLDLTPFAFSWTVAAMVVNVTWLRFLSLVPIARASVMERMPAGLIVVDEQTRIVDLNAVARRLMEVNGAAIGQPVESLMTRWPQLVARYRNALNVSETVELLAEDGKQLWVNVEITPLYDAQQSLRGRLIMWSDVSAIMHAEAALRQRNEELVALQHQHLLARDAAEAASRAKSAFLANMSHELRTPLTAIIGYTDLLRLETEQRGLKGMGSDLAAIRSAGDHLLELITQVLDLSRIEANKMELQLRPVQLEALLEDVARTVRPLVARNDNTFCLDGAEGAGTVMVDETKVRQVLLNLLSNAAKFTHGGQITLRFGREAAPGARPEVVFTVTDTGPGIDPAYLPRLFEPFTQADSSSTRGTGGAGLGLAISRQFCRLMGGDLAVTSELGAGSTFVARLPASPEL